MSRNPYPFPRYQNDEDFTKAGKGEGTSDYLHGPVKVDEDPWKRLNATATLTSQRREACHFDPLAPRDSLDFVLNARYNHHSALLQSKAETLIQPETLGLPHGRVLKNRPTVEEFHNRREMDYYQKEDPRKQSADSIGGAIGERMTSLTQSLM
jgi:hypothetical protein